VTEGDIGSKDPKSQDGRAKTEDGRKTGTHGGCLASVIFQPKWDIGQGVGTGANRAFAWG